MGLECSREFNINNWKKYLLYIESYDRNSEVQWKKLTPQLLFHQENENSQLFSPPSNKEEKEITRALQLSLRKIPSDDEISEDESEHEEDDEQEEKADDFVVFEMKQNLTKQNGAIEFKKFKWITLISLQVQQKRFSYPRCKKFLRTYVSSEGLEPYL